MEAVILAGGLGTQLREVVPDVPKSMAPVAGRPFLEILLTSLSRRGFRRIVVSLGYMAQSVVDHFGAEFSGMDLVYEIEQTPLGTGGATSQALKRCLTDHVSVINGDTYLDIDTAALEDHWQKHHNPAIVAREVPDTSRYGRLYTSNARLVGFSNAGHGGPGLISAGWYLLPRHILDGRTDAEAFSLEADWLPDALVQQRFDVFLAQGLFVDIGVQQDYVRAQELLEGICD